MEQSSYLREQADRCRRLARKISDLPMQQQLEHIAGDFEAQADAQRAGAPTGGPIATRGADGEQGSLDPN